MKARRIDLQPYPRTSDVIDASGKVLERKGEPYPVALNLRRWLLAPARNATGEQIVAAWDVAEQLDGDAALLPEADWQTLCQMFKELRGFGGDDVQTILRVLRAPEVEVGEK